jgi:cell division transport system permease protein
VKDHQWIEPTAKKLAGLPGIEKVNFAQEILQKIKQAARLMSLVGLVVTMILGALTMFIINNTMNLLIQARAREIEILRMMGVGNWYIRLPFLLQGSLYGLCGALLAYFPLRIVEFYIAELFGYFQLAADTGSEGFVLTLMVVIGVLVGGGGSAFAMHRYLKV